MAIGRVKTCYNSFWIIKNVNWWLTKVNREYNFTFLLCNTQFCNLKKYLENDKINSKLHFIHSLCDKSLISKQTTRWAHHYFICYYLSKPLWLSKKIQRIVASFLVLNFFWLVRLFFWKKERMVAIFILKTKITFNLFFWCLKIEEKEQKFFLNIKIKKNSKKRKNFTKKKYIYS